MNEKTMILHNPERDHDIVDYQIEEAEIDPKTGEAIIDTSNGKPKWTGKTLGWTLRFGETKEFPAYVARYLKDVYGFLQVKEKTEEAKEQNEERLEETAKDKDEDGSDLKCGICKISFSSKRALAMHVAAKHPDQVLALVK